MTTILILAGGKSERMGTDKLRLTLDGESLLHRVSRRFADIFPRVYISAGERDVEDVGLPVVRDIFPGCGPISGLHAAFTSLSCDSVFLVAADMPFADPELAQRIIDASVGYDICCAGTREYPEPLFARYDRAVFPLVENALKSGNYGLARIIRAMNTRYVDFGDSPSLKNVNTPEEFDSLTKNEKNGENLS